MSNEKNASLDDEWVKVEPNVWKPEQDGDEISGVLVLIEEGKGKYNSRIYHIETEASKQLVVYGTTVLDDEMKYFKAGDLIKIIYKGKRKTEDGKSEYHNYDVFKKAS